MPPRLVGPPWPAVRKELDGIEELLMEEDAGEGQQEEEEGWSTTTCFVLLPSLWMFWWLGVLCVVIERWGRWALSPPP